MYACAYVCVCVCVCCVCVSVCLCICLSVCVLAWCACCAFICNQADQQRVPGRLGLSPDQLLPIRASQLVFCAKSQNSSRSQIIATKPKTGGFSTKPSNLWRGDVAQLVDHQHRHAADAGSIPRCGKGFFYQSQLSVKTLLRCPYTPVRNRMHLHLCAR